MNDNNLTQNPVPVTPIVMDDSTQSSPVVDPGQYQQEQDPLQGTTPATDPGQQSQYPIPAEPTPTAPASVSVSPESAPVPIAPEAPAESAEYGYEELKRIEQANENLATIENKEVLQDQPTDPTQLQQNQPAEPVLPPPVKPQGPKFFGYFIPQTLTTNLQSIKNMKGTGDPTDARTWIYVLLDRLLKTQTYQD